MAGLIDPNFLTKNRPRLIGNAADQAMNFMAPAVSPTYLRTSQYPATQTAPNRVQVGSTGATTAPFSGQVAGTAQALSTPPPFDPGVPAFSKDVFNANEWSVPSFGSVVGAVKDVVGNVKSAVPGVGSYDWDRWAAMPDTIPKVTEGELSTPGIGEKTTEDTLKDLDKVNSAEMRALADQMMKYGGLGSRDFDKYYKNAWKHSQADLNRAYAGRGLYGSTDALRALGHARTDLAAQQVKDQAEFDLASMRNDIGRLATAGQLYGKISDTDLERWGLKQQYAHAAQRLEENRVRGGISDLSSNASAMIDNVMKSFGDMAEADQKLVLKLLDNLVAPYAEAANTEASSRAASEAQLAAILKASGGGL